MDLGIYPKYLFLCVFRFCPLGLFPIELLRFLWYLCHSYYIAIDVHFGFLVKNLRELEMRPYSPNFNKFFLWFDNMETRKPKLEQELVEYLKNLEHGVAHAYTTIIFHQYHTFIFHQHHTLTINGYIVSHLSYSFYRIEISSLHLNPLEYHWEFRKFQKHVF